MVSTYLCDLIRNLMNCLFLRGSSTERSYFIYVAWTQRTRHEESRLKPCAFKNARKFTVLVCLFGCLVVSRLAEQLPGAKRELNVEACLELAELDYNDYGWLKMYFHDER